MEISIKYYAMLREATDKKTEIINIPEKSSISDLLDFLVERYNKKLSRYIYDSEKKLKDYISFMLNGININSLNGIETTLKDGDILSLLPPVGGG